ncbi:hypothetical protein VP01_1251g2 [Puccinia sorghi]|uniref:Uncharacterized protein n=1 Tax=Puccinia sorghi TaxID=27349 RepID=A0A0L6VPN3_9BASI|nr:hypothetical protein VP01_1251g2 [Puccinia sorghi]
MRSKEPTQTNAPGKKWSEVPPVSNNWERKLDDITKQLAAFTSQKGVPPHIKSIQQPLAAPAPFREPSFKCYYCFQQNHSSNRCSILISLDKSSGSVKRIGKAYFLTDNTQIPWYTNKTGQLYQEGHGVYEIDLGKRRSGREYEEPELSKRKRNKQKQESVMDVEQEVFSEEEIKRAGNGSPQYSIFGPPQN